MLQNAQPAVAIIGEGKHSGVQRIQTEPFDEGRPHHCSKPLSEVAEEFGLPSDVEMILHCDVSVTVEENSVIDSSTNNAKM